MLIDWLIELILHSFLKFNTEDEEGVETDLGQESDGGGGLLTRFLSSSVRRVKRRIFYKNETLPTMDPVVFGNRTGRNNTISLIKLLNKNYYVIKKRYFEILANKSRQVPPSKFHGRDYLAKKKAEEAAKKGTPSPGGGATPGPGGAGGAATAPPTT